MIEKEYLFHFSQEHENIPIFEIESCLISQKIAYKIKESKKSICIISSKDNICERIINKLAYTHSCGRFLFKSTLELSDIKRNLKKIEILDELNDKSFRIRALNLNQKNKYSESLEKFIGQIIKDIIPNSKVNLMNPDIEFLGFFSKSDFYFCIKYFNSSRKKIQARPLKSRPFTHPSTLDPVLTRAMINLTKVVENSLILDPFCGTGTTLIEANHLKLKSIGIDINKKMIEGTRKNLTYYNMDCLGLIHGNFNKIFLKQEEFDSIVCDPPYGRSSSTHSLTLENLLIDFFHNSAEILKPKGLICMAMPDTINIIDILNENELKIKKIFHFYVHKSLTRQICILEKK